MSVSRTDWQFDAPSYLKSKISPHLLTVTQTVSHKNKEQKTLTNNAI